MTGYDLAQRQYDMQIPPESAAGAQNIHDDGDGAFEAAGLLLECLLEQAFRRWEEDEV